MSVAPKRPAEVDRGPFMERLFDFVPEEVSYRAEDVQGELPTWLRGTYYVNGPARFRRGSVDYGHWLDGDGMVAALRFDGGGPVEVAQRFVRSHKMVEEEAAGAPVYRTFGTGFGGDRLLRGIALASPVNVSVYPFAGKLLAFGEQGLPWELDPVTLETVAEHTFGGRLNAVSPFSAHPGFDRTPDGGTGAMVSFGISFAAERPTVNLYSFDPDGTLRSRRRAPLPYPASLHDFGLTPRFAVFYVNPHLLDMRRLMEEGATVMDCLSWRPELGSSLLVLDRETAREVARVPVGEGYCLHHAHAFEDGDRLVVDVLELEEPAYPDYRPVPDLFAEVAPAHPVRYEVELADGTLAGRREVPHARAADFPAVDPRRTATPTDRFWMLAISATGAPGRKFFDRLEAADFREEAVVDAWQAPEGRYLGGEPVFLPEPGSEEAGLVVVQEHDARERRTDYLLFDAFALAAGPVVRIPLSHPLQPGFHACWDPA